MRTDDKMLLASSNFQTSQKVRQYVAAGFGVLGNAELGDLPDDIIANSCT